MWTSHTIQAKQNSVKLFRSICDTVSGSRGGEIIPVLLRALVWSTGRGQKIDIREALVSLLRPEFKKRTRGDWLQTLSRYDIPCGPIQTVDQVFQDRQV